ncbi:MAG: NADH-quinone oxidoreductase subunit C [candidate division Zixibacteria bacterium]|nr:NADH-quinone oxidoreductase subunit C [candidate division Zixibacteria bacterium]
MTKEEIEKKITLDFKDRVEIQETNQPEPFVYISKDKYIEFCQYLKNDTDLSFEFLFQLGGSHFEDRFEVFLCLSSHKHRHEIVVKVKLPADNPEINSVINIWRVADFFELEVMELFGIMVVDHPNPRHLLLIEEWDYGYPMRKGWTGPDFIPMPDKSKSAE